MNDIPNTKDGFPAFPGVGGSNSYFPTVEDIDTATRVCRWYADMLEDLDGEIPWWQRLWSDYSKSVKELRKVAYNFQTDGLREKIASRSNAELTDSGSEAKEARHEPPKS